MWVAAFVFSDGPELSRFDLEQLFLSMLLFGLLRVSQFLDYLQ